MATCDSIGEFASYGGKRMRVAVVSKEATLNVRCGMSRYGLGRIGRGSILQVLAFALGSSLSMAQVLNMSHDLVTLGITGQNLTPNNSSLDARPLFQAALNYVQSHPVQTLTLDTGAYYLLTATQGNAVLIVPNLSNLTIDLAGSTIYFNGPLLPNGIQLYYCTNVTLTNFQLDYVNPPYTHVQLASVDTVNRVLTYSTLPGYPDPSAFNSLSGSVEGYWAAIFRHGAIVPGTSRTLLAGPFANNKITIQDGFPWAQSATLATLQTGDTVVVTARGGGPPLLIWECNGITLSKISIYGSPTWAIQLFQTSNSTVDRDRIVPRPGYGLIGSNADGIHFLMTGPNNHIRNCYVARTMDDALILESHHAGIVVSQTGPTQLTVTRDGYDRFPNGTLMNFVDRTTTLESTGGIIVSQNPPDGPGPSFNEQVNLTFDRNLPALAPGTIMAFGSPANRGQGSTIEDNLVEDTYGGRGVWLSGAQGVTIQRNVLRRTSNAGIAISSSTESVVDPGDASPPSHDVTVTDNALEQSLGPQAAGSGLETALAGVQVVTVSDPYFVFASTPSNTNITIQNNYIADSERSGIWIGELNGGTLQNNLVIRSSQNPTLGGVAGIPTAFQSQVMQDALVPVVIHYSTSVAEIGDMISASSPITAPVTMTPPSATLPAAAGSYSFTLQTAVTGFGWNAASNSSWLTVTSPVPGAGSGTVQYSVSANNTGAPRTGNITIAGVAFSLTQTTLTTPVLSIAKTHTGNFIFGQTGATYTITVSNRAGAATTSGLVTVTDTVPAGLTLVSMSGTGWNCSANTCTRSDAAAGGASYPAITATVNVAVNASSPLANSASVSGAGSASASASDPTMITAAVPLPSTLTVSPTSLHFGATSGGATHTGAQTVVVQASAGLGWIASPDHSFISVSPGSGNGTGSFAIGIVPGALPASGSVTGTVTISASGVTSQTVSVTAPIVSNSQVTGSFDTPVNNTTGEAGAVAVTGWALDSI